MATATLSVPTSRHSRVPWRRLGRRAHSPEIGARRVDLLTPPAAAVLSILGSIGAIATIGLALLVVPAAAAIVFGPIFLSLI